MESEQPAGELAALGERARTTPETNLRRRVHPRIAAGLLIVLVVSTGGVVVFRVGRAPHSATAATTRVPPATGVAPMTGAATAASPPAPLEVASTSPAPGTTTVGFSSDIAVQFSVPLAADTPDPALSPSVPGSWTLEGSSALVFRPNGYFAPLSRLLLTVPAGSLGPRGRRGQSLGSPYTASFTVAGASVLRLQQLLAELNYLPLRFDPAASSGPGPAPSAVSAGTRTSPAPVSAAATLCTTSADASAIASEPTEPGSVAPVAQPGSFSWRYPNIPASLSPQWQPGVGTVLVQGAVMAFESDHGLEANGVITATLWRDLLDAVAARQITPAPYDYLEVSTALPETLSVWQDGAVIFQSPANTGIPAAPTALGTFPVYARYVSTIMSGYNPNGTYYDDPGVPDVAYFKGGDAVHGFYRAAYGFPQSLGCVELPFLGRGSRLQPRPHRHARVHRLICLLRTANHKRHHRPSGQPPES